MVAEDKRKWSKIKAQSINYFKSVSIPGVSRIATTESFLLKLIWIVLIIITFGIGFQNISLAVTDYYHFDVITNVERVSPSNVTFPAITFCYSGSYKREYYKNRSLIRKDNINIKNDNISLFINFLVSSSTLVYSSERGSPINARNYLDTFKIPLDAGFRFSAECVRFNGVTNKSLELFKASSTEDYFEIVIKDSYKENINSNEYFTLSLSDKYVLVFIADNLLNSFENIQPFYLYFNKGSYIEIEKESIELKLPEPYNQCKEYSVEKPYHQSNCIDSCIYREIKNKYNCTFPLSLFAFSDLNQCDSWKSYDSFKKEFSAGCLKECPLKSCFSEKFYPTITSFSTLFPNFKFFFRDFSSLNITQIPKTDPFTFLNNIGGGLGLFMGIALPNLIEFLQFFVEILHVTLFQ